MNERFLRQIQSTACEHGLTKFGTAQIFPADARLTDTLLIGGPQSSLFFLAQGRRTTLIPFRPRRGTNSALSKSRARSSATGVTGFHPRHTTPEALRAMFFSRSFKDFDRSLQGLETFFDSIPRPTPALVPPRCFPWPAAPIRGGWYLTPPPK
jgi:hypothetical protein